MNRLEMLNPMHLLYGIPFVFLLTGKENVCKLDIELGIELCQNVIVVHVYM